MDSGQNKILDYKNLIVWQKSFKLALITYKISEKLPANERFGLASQIQRASIAIPSNIAEGCNRNHTAEYIQFLGIAMGSSAELETQLLLIGQLHTEIETKEALMLLIEVQKC